MDENKEENKEEIQTETEAAPTEKVRTKKTSATLDKADDIVERQKTENDRREAILDREEALAARRAVGGETEAGQEPKTKEESPGDYAAEVMKNE